MTSQQKQKIIELSDQLLTLLLDYRKLHPDFRFWLRSREHNKAGDQQRLAGGQWFQGSDYIFLSFHSASGHVNMTRSIGWVVEVDESLIPHYHISIVWPTEKDQRKINLYLDIIQQLGSFYKIAETKYRKDLPDGDMFDSLREFLEKTLPQINKLISQHGLTDIFTIPEEKFEARVDKVLQYKQHLHSKTEIESMEKTNYVERHSGALNTILYGPPGTGKTYYTIDKALQIIDSVFYEKHKENRIALTEKFKSLLITDWKNPLGQIAFITFHQSMSYEDFIEGIKPVRPETSATIHYEIVDGIFKKLCAEANRKSRFSVTVDEQQKELTKELFEQFYYSYSATLPDQKELISPIKLLTKERAEFELFQNGAESIVVKAGVKKAPMSLAFSELSAVLFDKKEPTYKSYEEIVIKEILKEKEFTDLQQDSSQKKFVLIIDEINRGNVSQIFGELITLIEDSKRQGQNEELTITLPYSKRHFAVPSNLHLIGTMNTADRSVEALDSALRRRFVFEEMQPKPELLTPQEIIARLYVKHADAAWNEKTFRNAADRLYDLLGIDATFENEVKGKNDYADYEKIFSLEENHFTGINPQKILTAINERLSGLLTKDHTIGHAWLMDVYSMQDLQRAFKNKIIPLLQEYFYNNYAKIGLVLGDKFVQQAQVRKNLFAKFTKEEETVSEYEDKIVYSLVDPFLLGIEDFRSIYL